MKRETFGKLGNRILIPLLVHTAILCALCVVVSLPPIWNAGYRTTMHTKLMGYEHGSAYMDDALLISAGLWKNESYAELSEKLKAWVLNTKEQRHFEDVRRLLRRAMIVVASLVPVLFFLRKRIQWRTVWSYALLFYAVEAAIVGIWSAIAWRHMFRTFHWWIFQNDSWILPTGSYSLFLFQHSVWKMAGTYVFLAFLVILLIGFALSRRAPDRKSGFAD